ncbi:heat shock protein Hsp20 [Salinarchaeum sp. Harcht-Bsk1]|uniref:Hsp20/alpha crystallin family protein n=1 Tax=Salinarchaeum sp. Harcht-Bsk1 TaxID=1333523 RepID=UPI0003423422|nr:Hsp20 family protein [Salinarchaeum sp. Harcht-Bsk1]AGN01499.1 heat shock protein Hsp20 [Salinarchaeum sp. Harcht-Bsk1]
MARNPFSELERLFDRMESQFEGQASFGSTVAVDVVDEDDQFVVEAELPGFEAGDLELTYSEGRLSIVAEREEHVEADYVRSERKHAVERTVRLPEPVDADAIDADLDDRGVLRVTLPKEAPAEAGKRIEIGE